MKKLLLLFVFLSSALLGNAQDVVKLTDGSPAWVPNYLIIEGNLYFLEDGTYTSLGDSLFNYVRKKDSSNLYYTPRQIDSLLDGKGYADTLWVQNTIHDSLTAFESSKWYDTPTGIAYDNDVEIGGSLRMPTLILNDSTMNYATFGNTIATKEYVDDMSGLGSGFTANVFFRTDYSDVPVGSEYRRIAYEPEETETILNRTINAGMGETLFTTYLYDDSLGTDLLDAGVYSVVYSCKVSNSSHVTQLAFEAFVRSTDGTETTLFKMYGEDINEVDDFVFFSTESTQPSFSVNPSDRFGVRISGVTTRPPDVTISTIAGGGRGSYFTTPIALRHNLLRGRASENAHPISAISGLQNELDDKLEVELDPVYTGSQASNITSTDITNLGNLSGVNTGDQDLSGYLTTETDPVFSASPADGITNTNISNWNTGYNHSQITTGNPHNISLGDIDESLASINYWTKNGTDLSYSGGNIGIGTTNPQYDLDVNGEGRFTGSLFAPVFNATTSTGGWTFKSLEGTGFYNLSTTEAAMIVRVGADINTILRSDGLDSYINAVSGNLAVGKTRASYKLDVNGAGRFTGDLYANNKFYIGEQYFAEAGSNLGINYNKGGALRFFGGGTSQLFRIDTNGDVTASGNMEAANFILSSDSTLKQNFQPLYNNSEIGSFYFKRDTTKRTRYGVIAQELQKTHPEMVYESADSTLAVAYTDYLLNRVASLQNQVNEIKQKEDETDTPLPYINFIILAGLICFLTIRKQ